MMRFSVSVRPVKKKYKVLNFQNSGPLFLKIPHKMRSAQAPYRHPGYYEKIVCSIILFIVTIIGLNYEQTMNNMLNSC